MIRGWGMRVVLILMLGNGYRFWSILWGGDGFVKGKGKGR